MIDAARLIQHRLLNQRLDRAPVDGPEAAVAWLGAVQAQDYLGALWAIGLRTPGATEAAVEAALRDRRLIRAWPVRGTLHIVAAAEIHWMLNLLAPPAIARSATRFRQLELDEATLTRSRKVIAAALAGGAPLTRDELYARLKAARISTAGQRGIHLLWRAAQEGELCFGPRRGKQQTFVALTDWAPAGRVPGREWALAELTRRYFASRGPATLADFVWWSGLPVAEARAGLEMAQRHLIREVIAGQPYWRANNGRPGRASAGAAALLPAFDEYLVGYKDRGAVLDSQHVRRINAGGGLLAPAIMIGGQIRGTWKRVFKKQAVVVTPAWFAPPTAAQERAFVAAAERYAKFLGVEGMSA